MQSRLLLHLLEVGLLLILRHRLIIRHVLEVWHRIGVLSHLLSRRRPVTALFRVITLVRNVEPVNIAQVRLAMRALRGAAVAPASDG